MRQNMSATLATRRTATENPYTRWLHTWLKCDEAPGSLTLIDSSGNGNHVSPNFAPVWRPLFTVGTASYLKCMRPATPFNSGMLIEPTAVGASGGITGATEPNWGAMTAGTSLTENAGPNSITWTFRTPTINLGANGVTPGLGGAVCVPKSSSGFDNLFGFMKTDTWEYTATTLSCTTVDINDTAGLIPAGLAVGDALCSTGWAGTLDNQGVGAVTAVTASKITIAMFAADTNAGNAPITLRRVHLQHSLAICAKIVGQTTAFTNPAHLFRLGPTFGSGSNGALRSYYRENGGRQLISQLLSPVVGDATSAVTSALTANVSTHFCAIWDRTTSLKAVYLNGVFNVQAAIQIAQKAVLRDIDPTAWANRMLQLSFFHGDAKVAFKDVQLYVMPAPQLGMSSNANFRDMILSIMAGNGPPHSDEWT